MRLIAITLIVFTLMGSTIIEPYSNVNAIINPEETDIIHIAENNSISDFSKYSADETKRIIDVPYYHQQSLTGCSIACVRMALAYLEYPKRPPDWHELFIELRTSPEEGTSTTFMPLPFHSRGYWKVTEKIYLTPRDLRDFVNHGYLTIIMIWGDKSINITHSVLVTGYDVNGFYIHDPWHPAWLYELELQARVTGEEIRQTGPNTYIPEWLLLDLWDCNAPYWGLQIPYKSILIKPYKCTITVQGIPSNLVELRYDDKNCGKMKINQQVFEFDIATAHTFKVEPEIEGESNETVKVTYRCQHYTAEISSLGEEVSHIFYYEPYSEYYLKLNSKYGDPQGEGWYKEGEAALISVESTIPLNTSFVGMQLGNLGAVATFEKWVGDITFEDNETKLQIIQPTIVNATWIEDHTRPNLIITLVISIPLTIFIVLILIMGRHRTLKKL